jgi:hypothetical protein
MISESKGDLMTLAEIISQYWPTEYISSNQFNGIVERFADRVGLYDMKNPKTQLKRIFNNITYPLHESAVIKLDGKVQRLRVFIGRDSRTTAKRGDELTQFQRESIREELCKPSLTAALLKIESALDGMGM